MPRHLLSLHVQNGSIQLSESIWQAISIFQLILASGLTAITMYTCTPFVIIYFLCILSLCLLSVYSVLICVLCMHTHFVYICVHYVYIYTQYACVFRVDMYYVLYVCPWCVCFRC